MNKSVRRALKISGVSLGSLLVIAAVAVAVVIHFVFTPARLTPAVVEVANRQLNAKLSLGSVDLTFFSSFPRFGLRLRDGSLVSKALRDSAWLRRDTLLTFSRATLVLNPIDYLRKQRISVYRLTIDSARVYAHIDKDGRANWDIVPDAMEETSADTAATDTAPLAAGGIDIRRLALRHATVTFDDRQARVFANVWDANLRLQARLHQGFSLLRVDYSNRNILFFIQGIGTSGSQLILSPYADSKKAWNITLIALASLMIPILMMLSRTNLDEKKGKAQINEKTEGKISYIPLLILILSLSFYTIAEHGVTNYIISYGIALGRDSAEMGRYLALYSLGIMSGRLILGSLISRTGAERMLLSSLIVGSISFFLIFYFCIRNCCMAIWTPVYHSCSFIYISIII